MIPFPKLSQLFRNRSDDAGAGIRTQKRRQRCGVLAAQPAPFNSEPRRQRFVSALVLVALCSRCSPRCFPGHPLIDLVGREPGQVGDFLLVRREGLRVNQASKKDVTKLVLRTHPVKGRLVFEAEHPAGIHADAQLFTHPAAHRRMQTFTTARVATAAVGPEPRPQGLVRAATMNQQASP